MPTQIPLPNTLPIPAPIINYDDIRKFSDKSVQDAVEDAIANTQLPEGTKGAVVAHMTLEGARISLIAKLPNDHWSVAVDAYKPYSGKLEAGAKVVFHW